MLKLLGLVVVAVGVLYFVGPSVRAAVNALGAALVSTVKGLLNKAK